MIIDFYNRFENRYDMMDLVQRAIISETYGTTSEFDVYKLYSDAPYKGEGKNKIYYDCYHNPVNVNSENAEYFVDYDYQEWFENLITNDERELYTDLMIENADSMSYYSSLETFTHANYRKLNVEMLKWLSDRDIFYVLYYGALPSEKELFIKNKNFKRNPSYEFYTKFGYPDQFMIDYMVKNHDWTKVDVVKMFNINDFRHATMISDWILENCHSSYISKSQVENYVFYMESLEDVMAIKLRWSGVDYDKI